MAFYLPTKTTHPWYFEMVSEREENTHEFIISVRGLLRKTLSAHKPRLMETFSL